MIDLVDPVTPAWAIRFVGLLAGAALLIAGVRLIVSAVVGLVRTRRP